MRKTLLTIIVSVLNLLGLNAANKVEIDHVHPTCWWAGMQNTELQIMIHGKELAGLDVELKDATNITVKDIILGTQLTMPSRGTLLRDFQ